MKCKAATSIVFLCFLLTGCITTEPGQKSLTFDAKQNTFTHEQSGFSFPSKIGRFQRDNNIKFYGDTGVNFSVHYNIVTKEEKAIGTVYVYPGMNDYSITPVPKLGQTPEWFLKQAYDGAKNAIIDIYRARVLSEGEIRLDRSLRNPIGKKGVFEWDTVGGETVFSQLYLFAYKGWLVKFRFTFPSKNNALIDPEIARFMELFQWP